MTIMGFALQPMHYLIAGVVALLAVSSLIGWVLARRVTDDPGLETVRNLNARIKAWWAMVAIFAVAFTFGKTVTLILFGLTSFYALREFY